MSSSTASRASIYRVGLGLCRHRHVIQLFVGVLLLRGRLRVSEFPEAYPYLPFLPVSSSADAGTGRTSGMPSPNRRHLPRTHVFVTAGRRLHMSVCARSLQIRAAARRRSGRSTPRHRSRDANGSASPFHCLRRPAPPIPDGAAETTGNILILQVRLEIGVMRAVSHLAQIHRSRPTRLISVGLPAMEATADSRLTHSGTYDMP